MKVKSFITLGQVNVYQKNFRMEKQVWLPYVGAKPSGQLGISSKPQLT
jgi:hypothetical protein